LTPAELKKLEANLWQSADTLRANSDLKSSEYATLVLGSIFLKFADNKYLDIHLIATLSRRKRLNSLS
jgi:type I restriction enzyme M protein